MRLGREPHKNLTSKTVPQSADDTDDNSAEIRRPSLPKSDEDEPSIALPPQSEEAEQFWFARASKFF